jgi:multidrug efflux pump subunit AcrA (membrane-fusion protein)
VDFTGQAVRKGMPLLTIYSQELLASQEEYLQARQAATQFQGSSLPEVRKGGDDLVRAARRRLELFDVPKGFIEQLERTGKPRRAVPLMAPSSGVVTAKQIFEGQQVEPNMELFTVTDLSHVWIVADLYENEASQVRVGDDAVLTLTSDPRARLTGRVKYVFPYLNPETRTLKVRFEFGNADGALKPGMYANVQLALQTADGVVVPDAAVMDTGLRQVVFVAGANGMFEPRAVKVGIRTEGRAQILEGLKEGERVVVAANFLLDSESRLRSALAPAGGQADASTTIATTAPAAPVAPADNASTHSGRGAQ